jgi:hypothetical protein
MCSRCVVDIFTDRNSVEESWAASHGPSTAPEAFVQMPYGFGTEFRASQNYFKDYHMSILWCPCESLTRPIRCIHIVRAFAGALQWLHATPAGLSCGTFVTYIRAPCDGSRESFKSTVLAPPIVWLLHMSAAQPCNNPDFQKSWESSVGRNMRTGTGGYMWHIKCYNFYMVKCLELYLLCHFMIWTFDIHSNSMVVSILIQCYKCVYKRYILVFKWVQRRSNVVNACSLGNSCEQFIYTCINIGLS